MPARLRFRSAFLLLAIGCGAHDTPVATYNAPLPDPTSDPDPEPACAQTYPLVVPGLTSRYREVTAGKPWVIAQQDCESDGGHLVVVDDEVENAWMAAFAERSLTDSASTHQLAWLGLSDHAVEGEFRWLDGAPPTLAFWADQEPNSLNDAEDCVEIRPTGEWNDDRCNAELSYVCECDGAALAAGTWCDTDSAATCGDCSTSCGDGQSCVAQACR